VALAFEDTLRISIGEIGRAFLTGEAAIPAAPGRRKQYAKRAFPSRFPRGGIVATADVVLQTLYLLFNEGHKASTGERRIRDGALSRGIRRGRCGGANGAIGPGTPPCGADALKRGEVAGAADAEGHIRG